MAPRRALFFIILFAFAAANSYSTTEEKAVEQVNECFQTGMPEKAIAIAERFKSPAMQRLKFIAAVKCGNLSDAKRILPALKNIDGELSYYIGLFYEESGEYKKAAEFYAKEIGENPFKAISLYAASRCAEKSGDVKAADSYRKKASDAESSRFSPPKSDERKPQPAAKIRKSGKIVRMCLGEGIASFTATLDGSGKKIEISCKEGKIFLSKNGGTAEKVDSGYKISGSNGTVALSNVKRRGYTSVDLSKAGPFCGEIELLIRGNAITLVNRTDLEDLLCGVVPSEMFPEWPCEALKAQAVAARSYVLSRMLHSNNKDYDVHIVKNIAYSGKLRENLRTRAAVDATYGIAMFNKSGKPLDAMFCTNCGGYSCTPRTAWGGNTDVNADFKAVPDKKLEERTSVPTNGQIAEFIKNPPDAYSYVNSYIQPQSYRWVVQKKREELEKLVDPKGSIGEMTGIFVEERDISGRALRVKILGTRGDAVLKAPKIAKSLGSLKSTLFVCEYESKKNALPDTFTFIGAGWGHGVGMCQSGAAGMALDGIGYREILMHYYPLASVRECY